MADLFDNPMGTDGFEFVEYTAPDPELLRSLFERMGFQKMYEHMFPLADPPDYEPAPERSIAARAEREGRPVAEVFYDAYLEHDGSRLLLFTLGGYAHRNSDHVVSMPAMSSRITMPPTISSFISMPSICVPIR